jgi:hypothetical protein
VRLLQLSARGAQRLREACGACDDAVERVLAARPDDELHALSRLLSSVAEATQRHAGSAGGAQAPVAATRDWRRWG